MLVLDHSGGAALGGAMRMPRVGLGTFRLKSHELKRALTTALAAGVRLVDTAGVYVVC